MAFDPTTQFDWSRARGYSVRGPENEVIGSVVDVLSDEQSASVILRVKPRVRPDSDAYPRTLSIPASAIGVIGATTLHVDFRRESTEDDSWDRADYGQELGI